MQSSQKLRMGMGSPSKFGLLSTKSASLLELLPCQSILNSTASKNYGRYELVVNNDQFQNQVKLLDWRVKTDLPIVKVIFYKILPKKTPLQNSVIQVSIQHFSSSLQNLPKLSLAQVLTYMKAALNGFENLFARFGTFDISDKMILIDKLSQCKVWCNQNISLNYPSSRQAARNQIEMKKQIAKVFEQKCIKSISSTQFFSGVSKISKMFETIQFIDNFSKKNKFALTTKMTNVNEVPSSQQNFNKSMENLQTFKSMEFFKKKPNFIKSGRDEKKGIPPKLFFQSPVKEMSLNKNIQPLILTSRSEVPKFTEFSPCKMIKNDTIEVNTDQISPLKSTIPWSLKPAKKLVKQVSHDDFQGFKSVLVSKLKTENNLASKRQPDEMPEQLFYTKIPTTLKKNYKKIYNDDENMKYKNQQFLMQSLKSLDLKKNMSYQQASVAKQFIRKEKNQLAKVPEYVDQEKKHDAFTKNGWLKRLNSLTVGNIRQTMQSQSDGNDILAEDLRCESQKLPFLGLMGRQMNKSIISPD